MDNYNANDTDYDSFISTSTTYNKHNVYYIHACYLIIIIIFRHCISKNNISTKS